MDLHGLVSNAPLDPTVTERMLSHALAVLKEKITSSKGRTSRLYCNIGVIWIFQTQLSANL